MTGSDDDTHDCDVLVAGAGITLGPALTFGYIAGKHLAPRVWINPRFSILAAPLAGMANAVKSPHLRWMVEAARQISTVQDDKMPGIPSADGTGDRFRLAQRRTAR